MSRRFVIASLAVSSAATLMLGGCVYKTQKEVVAAPVAAPTTDRVVTYSTGRYQLYGDSTTGYYWVWIPAGASPPALPPPPPRLSERR